jgi:hypothetical protein
MDGVLDRTKRAPQSLRLGYEESMAVGPPLKSDAVRLDDIGSMAMLHKHATLSLSLDQEFQKIIKDTAWSLIASLFTLSLRKSLDEDATGRV